MGIARYLRRGFLHACIQKFCINEDNHGTFSPCKCTGVNIQYILIVWYLAPLISVQLFHYSHAASFSCDTLLGLVVVYNPTYSSEA